MSVRVGFQGELGAFSEEAVRALYGEEVEPIPYREFRAVGEAVLSQDVEAGLLPVENSLAGSVVVAYDVLAELPLRVVAEIVRPIRHFLLGVSGPGLAAERYGLDILAADVQDRPDNQTRFYAVVGGDEAGEVGTPPGAGSTSRSSSRAPVRCPGPTASSWKWSARIRTRRTRRSAT